MEGAGTFAQQTHGQHEKKGLVIPTSAEVAASETSSFVEDASAPAPRESGDSELTSAPAPARSSSDAHTPQGQQSNRSSESEKEREKLLPSLDPPPSNTRKLTRTVIAVLIGGTLIILGILAFWTFLWFGNNSNAVWHRIMVGNHLIVIVTITSEVLNKILGWMTGTACAMLAALALERGEVLFPHLPSLAGARSGFGGGSSFGWGGKIVSGKWASKGWSILLPTAMLLVCILQLLVSGTHTLLNSDINLATLPNGTGSFATNYGFAWHTANLVNQSEIVGEVVRTSTWKQKPPFYPAFAEYTEPPYVAHGVSDTGVVLRAFLPFQDALSRQTLHTYQGRTTVLDARVTCQVPILENTTVEQQNSMLIFSGYVRASRSTPRLGNVTYVSQQGSTEFHPVGQHNGPVPFTCAAFVGSTSLTGGLSNTLNDQWRIAMCQLSENGVPTGPNQGLAGGLVSEFKNYTAWTANAANYNNSYSFGTAYLMFNVSTGVPFVWQEAFDTRTRYAVDTSGTQDEWLTMAFPHGLSAATTLCYSAFDTADIAVNISSTRTRSEGEPSYNFTMQRYDFGALRQQYGQIDSTSTEGSATERDVLTLEPQSWDADADFQPPVEPYIRAFTNLGWDTNFGPGTGNNPYWTAPLFDASVPEATITYDTEFSWLVPDPMHVWFFQEIIANGGSVAFALSSLITLLSSMAYYDQIGQFDANESVQQSYFITTNLPTKSIGWSIVSAYFFVNVLFIACITFWFLHSTTYTLLNQSWQHLAQSMTPEVVKYADVAFTMTDDEVKALMKQTGMDKVHVKLRKVDDTDRVAIECVEPPDLGQEGGILEHRFVDFPSKIDCDERPMKSRWWNPRSWRWKRKAPQPKPASG